MDLGEQISNLSEMFVYIDGMTGIEKSVISATDLRKVMDLRTNDKYDNPGRATSPDNLTTEPRSI